MISLQFIHLDFLSFSNLSNFKFPNLYFSVWGCVARAKGMIWSGVSCLGLFASLYVCGPSATLCLKFTGRRMRALRKRQQKYAATENENEEKSAEAKSTAAPEPSTPKSRKEEPEEEDPPEDE